MKRFILYVFMSVGLCVSCDVVEEEAPLDGILTSDTFEVSPQGGTLMVLYHTDKECGYIPNKDWISTTVTVDPDSKVAEISINVLPNLQDGASDRDAEIYIVDPTNDDMVYETISVKQEKPYFNVSETSYNWKWNESVEKIVNIESNIGVKMSTSSDSFNIKQHASGTSYTIAPKSINTAEQPVKENCEFYPDIPDVYISSYKKTLTLTQTGFIFTLDDNAQDIEITIGPEENYKTVKVTCDDNWTPEYDDELVDVEYDTSNREQYIKVVRKPITDDEAKAESVVQRETDITLTADCDVTRKIKVTLFYPSDK